MSLINFSGITKGENELPTGMFITKVRLIALLTPGGIWMCDMFRMTLNFKSQNWGHRRSRDTWNGLAVPSVEARGRSCSSCSKARSTQTFLLLWPKGFLNSDSIQACSPTKTGPRSAGRDRRIECTISSCCRWLLQRPWVCEKKQDTLKMSWVSDFSGLGFIGCILSFHMSFCLLLSPIEEKNSKKGSKSCMYTHPVLEKGLPVIFSILRKLWGGF